MVEHGEGAAEMWETWGGHQGPMSTTRGQPRGLQQAANTLKQKAEGHREGSRIRLLPTDGAQRLPARNGTQ